MIRWLVVCAACGSAPPAPAPPPVAPATPAPPTAVAPPVPANQMLARVVLERTNVWYDIAVDGTDAAALARCTTLVGRVTRQRIANLVITVARTCEATQLPRARTSGFVLRFIEDQMIADAASGTYPDDATGATIRTAWFPTAAACAREQVQVAADRATAQIEINERMGEFLRRQRTAVEARAKERCDDATKAKARRCRSDETACITDRQMAALSCTREQELVDSLRAREAAAPADPEPPPPCEPSP